MPYSSPGQKSDMVSPGLSQVSPELCSLLEASEDILFPCPFQLLKVVFCPWLMIPYEITFPASTTIVPGPSSNSSLLPPSYKDLCCYIEQIHKIQDNCSISKSLIWSHLNHTQNFQRLECDKFVVLFSAYPKPQFTTPWNCAPGHVTLQCPLSVTGASSSHLDSEVGPMICFDS